MADEIGLIQEIESLRSQMADLRAQIDSLRDDASSSASDPVASQAQPFGQDVAGDEYVLGDEGGKVEVVGTDDSRRKSRKFVFASADDSNVEVKINEDTGKVVVGVYWK